MAQQARQLPVRQGAPMPRRALRQPARRPRLIRALLLRLFRLLFVEPVGRKAREERLAVPERTLRDIGLRRADVQAAALGLVPLAAVMRRYPSPGPLCVCGRPGFRPVVVRLSQAA